MFGTICRGYQPISLLSAAGLLGIVFSALAGSANILGALISTRIKQPKRNVLNSIVGAVAGFLLAAAFVDLIPEIAHEAGRFLPLVFIGYLIVYIMESLVPAHVHEHDDHEDHSLHVVGGWAATLGLAIHSFFDGITLMATFLVSLRTGVLIFIAIALHSLPVGFSLGSVLRASKQSTRSIVWASSGLFLATVLGAVFTVLTGQTEPDFQFALLALSAGALIYIGATDMIPMTHHGGSPKTILASLAGAVSFYILKVLLATLGFEA